MMNRKVKKVKKQIGKGLWGLMAALVASVVAAPSALAQSSSAAAETTIAGGTLVIITYLGLWLIFGGVLVGAIVHLRRLQRDLDGLEERLDDLLDSN